MTVGVDKVGPDLLRADMENTARRLARCCIPVTRKNRKGNQDLPIQELSSSGPAISAVKRGRSQRLLDKN